MMYQGLQGGVSSLLSTGDPKPKTKAATAATTAVLPPPISGSKPKKKPIPYDMGAEMRKYGKTGLAFDEERSATSVAKSAATRMGVSPSLLFSSAWQEGMNKAALSPDDISEAYKEHESELQDYPVDGFLNYGIDTIGSRYEQLKKYLPEGFEERMKLYDATNEKNEQVKTAAFKTNEDALMAKAAFLRMNMDEAGEYAKEKGVDLDDNAKNYFALAFYNGGEGNGKKMLDEYVAAKDKQKFINDGLTTRKGVHKNIKGRLDNMKVADELLKDEE